MPASPPQYRCPHGQASCAGPDAPFPCQACYLAAVKAVASEHRAGLIKRARTPGTWWRDDGGMVRVRAASGDAVYFAPLRSGHDIRLPCEPAMEADGLCIDAFVTQWTPCDPPPCPSTIENPADLRPRVIPCDSGEE